ncbi:MAG: thioredoxin family protein [Candidatus Methanofastidiosia archaeon]
MISEKDKELMRAQFEKLENEVSLVYFTQEHECKYCEETRELLEEVSSLSQKIKLEVYDFVADREKAESYSIDKIPATVVEGEKDYGIRFFGIPSGYEFSSLIEDIVDVSRGKTDLSEESKKSLKKINRKVHIQVFVTPTCPYCPSAVRLAHKLSIESPHIRGEMIEAIEFPHLASKYSVFGVPKTVVNDKVEFEGAVPEKVFVENVLKAL